MQLRSWVCTYRVVPLFQLFGSVSRSRTARSCDKSVLNLRPPQRLCCTLVPELPELPLLCSFSYTYCSFICLCIFSDSISLCSPGWLQSCLILCLSLPRARITAVSRHSWLLWWGLFLCLFLVYFAELGTECAWVLSLWH